MARKYNTVTTIRIFANDEGQAAFSNSKWTPYKDGSPADLHLKGNSVYSVRAFPNDDGSLGVQISEVVEYHGTDDITDGISQQGMRPIGEAMQKKHVPDSAISLDDDIPF